MAHKTQGKGNDFLVGAAIGSMLGSVTALMLAPKSGKNLREDLQGYYGDAYNRTNKAAKRFAKQGKTYARSMNGSSNDWMESAKCLLCNVKNYLGFENEEENEHAQRDLMIGGVVGGLLGAAAGLLLAPKPGSELREDLAERYEDVAERGYEMAEEMSRHGKEFANSAKSNAGKWISVAMGLLEEWADQAEEKGSEIGHQAKNKLNNLADWASVGYKVWQEYSKRR